MKSALIAIVTAALLIAPQAQAGLFDKKSADEERQELQEARSDALGKLYAERPQARNALAEAKGYAVFSNFGMNLGLVSTERGGGILRDNGTGRDTYMKMFSAGGGWGLGIKDFALIFVFHTEDAMEQFQDEGWDFAAQADAAAESEDKGAGMEAAATVMPGTSIYQLTDAGLALQATLKGTKFWADEDLN